MANSIDINTIEKVMELVDVIISIVGRHMTLGDVKTWLDVQENADRLIDEVNANVEQPSTNGPGA
jgi:hypothetical protein